MRQPLEDLRGAYNRHPNGNPAPPPVDVREMELRALEQERRLEIAALLLCSVLAFGYVALQFA